MGQIQFQFRVLVRGLPPVLLAPGGLAAHIRQGAAHRVLRLRHISNLRFPR